MMKRLVTIFFAAALAGLAGGQLNAQDPSAPTNSDASLSNAVTLAGGTNAQHTILFPDGTVYKGEVKDHKPDGWGTLADTRGSYQKGEWRNGGAYRVTGTCVFPDKTKEEGTWNADGTKCGGTIWYADQRIYKGDWVIMDGQPELPFGAGTMTWPDGRQYAGRFVGGKMDGAGKMTYPDGKIQDGTWKQDAFVGPAK